MKDKVLVVDDEHLIRWTLTEALSEWQYEPLAAASYGEALDVFENEQPLIILLDINLPDGSGLDLLTEFKARQPQAIIIMITANILVNETIAALRAGAYDFIGKPIDLKKLQVTIKNGLETLQLRSEINHIRREQACQFGFEHVIGQSPAMQRTLEMARKVALSEAACILLQGESGTGKDVLAKAIHFASRQANKPFVAINCAAIPPNLIESELFGYEKGAFTDARARKEGLLEQVQGGTLFLDEIGELEINLQAKLLRVLEGKTFRRVGGLRDLYLKDMRIIAASNRDLKKGSQAGQFRLDLYYRLSVIQIDIPALRERGNDVLLLANYFISSYTKPMRKRIRRLSPEAEQFFLRYPWPGNVRELRNVIERALILEESEHITTTYLPLALTEGEELQPLRVEPPPLVATYCRPAAGVCEQAFQLPPEGVSIVEVEESLIRQAMRRCKDNQTNAAKLLGISRDQLRYRLKKMRAQAGA